MADYGLLGGIASGLKSGIESYVDVSSKMREAEADAIAKKNKQDYENLKIRLSARKQGLLPEIEGNQIKGFKKDPDYVDPNAFLKEMQARYYGTRIGDLASKPQREKQNFILERESEGYSYIGDDETGKPMFEPTPETRRKSELEAQEMQSLIESRRAQAAKARREAQRKSTPKLSEAQKYVDREFGKEYARWTGGAFANVQSNLEKLEDVVNQLKTTDEATGTFVGLIPKAVRDLVTPEGAALQDTVESVIMQTLKETLGAQFTEREAKKLLETAYNPRLSEEENAKRLQRTIQQIKSMVQAKQDAAKYYERAGTLRGFKGSEAVVPMTKPKPIQRDLGPPEEYKPGIIRNGYRFKGGDPTNRRNWEKVE